MKKHVSGFEYHDCLCQSGIKASISSLFLQEEIDAGYYRS
jgi:hypothetical protein